MISFKNQTIMVIRAGTVTERGDDLPDWSTATEHSIEDCRLQPMATEEIQFTGSTTSEGGSGRDAVITRWKLFGPDGSEEGAQDIGPLDRVRFRGAVYDVHGQVQWWPSPTGVLAHFECVLKLVEG